MYVYNGYNYETIAIIILANCNPKSHEGKSDRNENYFLEYYIQINTREREWERGRERENESEREKKNKQDKL